MQVNIRIEKSLWLLAGATTGISAMAATLAMALVPTGRAMPSEIHAKRTARWVESSSERVLADMSASVDGVATVDSAGFSRGRFVVDVDGQGGKRRMAIAVSGMGGIQLSTIVRMNGQLRKANVTMDKRVGCGNETCPAVVRVTIDDGLGPRLDIYVPAAVGG